MNFQKLNNQIHPLSETAIRATKARWDSIAKPVGSLGQLEELTIRIAGIQGGEPNIDKRGVLVLCADNGVCRQGVASTPSEITAVMAGFIAQKRSSVCVMACYANADVIPVDMGMLRVLEEKNLLDRRLASGTADMTQGPAMTRAQAEQAIETGIELVRSCKEQGYRILATGEMGIGNTTTSSAVASVLLARDPFEMTGRGAGLSDEGLERKISAIRRAIEVNKPDPEDALDVLYKLGGFDLAGLCGVFLGGALYRVPVLIDGFISAVAALIAVRLCPNAGAYLLPSHASAEPAAQYVLDELRVLPILHANMRLGEGTGAVAVLPLLDMALAVYR
ncbi:MAG TPA: nicotinate-nucleotide--dimethylbenzimidazole phosphoribosyltransferase, partial [Feifaniaceae bacterium]|nr:nicotinate-nucleotide--dimethylbenzimidazole phosphoribosyltransferase [Feifaniaceae bacterium]